MAHNDNSRRQHLSANLRSALTTAAVVGTIGGWVAFGSQQTTTTVATSTPAAAQASDPGAVAQVADASAAVVQSGVQSQTASQSSASSQSTSRVRPVATTRSSS